MSKTAHRMKNPIYGLGIYNENRQQECGISDDCISIGIRISSSKISVIQGPFQTKNATSIVACIGRSVVLIIGTPAQENPLCGNVHFKRTV